MENSERDGNTRPPNLPLRNLYAGQEATFRTGHGTKAWFQIGKEACQGCILSPCFFNLYAEYSCLENPMNGGAWWAAVHGVAKSQTRLSDFTFTFHFHALEKEMAPLQCSCLENPMDGGAW